MTLAHRSVVAVVAGALLLAAAAGSAWGGAADDGWWRVKSRELRFRAAFPGEVTIDRSKSTPDNPSGTVHCRVGEVRYMVSCHKAEILKHRNNPLAVASYLVQFCMKFQQDHEGTVVEQAERWSGNSPGRYHHYHSKKSGEDVRQWFVVGEDFEYGVMVYSPLEHEVADDVADRFFDSFEVMPVRKSVVPRPVNAYQTEGLEGVATLGLQVFLNSVAQGAGLQQARTRAVAEQGLRSPRLRVVEPGGDTDGTLTVRVNLHPAGGDRYVFVVDTVFSQPATLKRDADISTEAVTWMASTRYGSVSRSQRDVVAEQVADQMKQFMADWLAVNPEPVRRK